MRIQKSNSLQIYFDNFDICIKMKSIWLKALFEEIKAETFVSSRAHSEPPTLVAAHEASQDKLLSLGCPQKKIAGFRISFL